MQVTMLENVKLGGKFFEANSVVIVTEEEHRVLIGLGAVALPEAPKKAEPVKEPKKG